MEEPRWTTFMLRREQQLRQTNLRSASALGAPGKAKLGARMPGSFAVRPHPKLILMRFA